MAVYRRGQHEWGRFTYVFLWGAIVELIWLNADLDGVLELHLEHGVVIQLLVNQVLLQVAVQGGRSLRQFAVFEGDELFLMGQTVPDVRVVHLLILYHAGEVVLVVGL